MRRFLLCTLVGVLVAAGCVPQPVQPGPRIIGEPVVGTPLLVDAGEWIPAASAVSVEWLSCVDASYSDCRTVTGSGPERYVVDSEDIGRWIGALVTATGTDGTNRVHTGLVGPVRAGQPYVFGHATVDGNVPMVTWSMTSTGGTADVATTGPGDYRVVFSGIGGTGGVPAISPSSEGGHPCALTGWGPASENAVHEAVTVRCYGPTGPAPSNFSISYVRVDGPPNPDAPSYASVPLSLVTDAPTAVAGAHSATGAAVQVTKLDFTGVTKLE